MAKARAGRGGAGGGLEAELSCPICLCLYREPVSLSCGHSFCRQCIEKVLGAPQDSQGPYTCPVCRVRLGPVLELQKNFQLCSIVEAFQATVSREKEGQGAEQGETGEVPCAYCLDGPQPAVKTCLVCDVSLCQAHLSKHNAKVSQQEHILVEVGAGEAEERKCPEHGKLLECYCQEDGKCICVLCSIAGVHKGHRIITMKQGHEQKLDKLSNIMTWLEKYRDDVVVTIEMLQKSKHQVKTNVKTVTSQLQEVFENIKVQLVEKERKILSDVQSREEKQLADIDKAREEMEQKREEAEQNLQSLQKITEQPDTFLFFKELNLVRDRFMRQDFRTETVKVKKVQMDQTRIAQLESLGADFMSHLDSLLQELQNKLTNQMYWSRWSSARRDISFKSLRETLA